jgi:hypothetical protein
MKLKVNVKLNVHGEDIISQTKSLLTTRDVDDKRVLLSRINNATVAPICFPFYSFLNVLLRKHKREFLSNKFRRRCLSSLIVDKRGDKFIRKFPFEDLRAKKTVKWTLEENNSIDFHAKVINFFCLPGKQKTTRRGASFVVSKLTL